MRDQILNMVGQHSNGEKYIIQEAYVHRFHDLNQA